MQLLSFRWLNEVCIIHSFPSPGSVHSFVAKRLQIPLDYDALASKVVALVERSHDFEFNVLCIARLTLSIRSSFPFISFPATLFISFEQFAVCGL
jgi:hypothetical protein